MATPGYEGGIGGKFRRRLLRRPAATPYDRPPAAARGLRALTPEPGGNGWLAKLVDPASRFIASSASRLFSSVFQKRLTAPPAAEAPGENSQSRQVTETASDELPAELRENKTDDANNATNYFESNTILEFEQLLKQKTFTRAQFEHLTEILRSRTTDLDVSKPTVNNDKVDEINVSLAEKGLESSHVDLQTPPDIPAIPDDRGAASPVELAKAYMGSRVSTVSPSALSWRSHLFHDHKNVPSNSTYATKPFALKSAKSVRFSGSTEIPETGYLTPRSHGRSAIYRMSRSPYFKGEGSSKDGYAGSLSLLTPESTRQLGGRQVLKRRSSVLESDFGSFGPIRRIRQKFTVTSPSKVTHLSCPGNLHASPSISSKNDVQDDLSLIQKPLRSDEHEHGDNRTSKNAVAPVVPQSSEMEKKILQRLDKLVPSPKEKSSKLKANPLDESPANVMHAFSSHAPKNNGDNLMKYKIVRGNNLDSIRGSSMPDIRNSFSQKQVRIGVLEENGPSTSSVSGVKLMSEADVMHDGVKSVTAATHGNNAAYVMISNPIAGSPPQKLIFQLSAPKDTLEVNNTYTLMDASGPLKNKMSTDKSVRPSLVRTDGSPPTIATSVSSYSDFSKAADQKLSVDSIAENSKGFTFPFVSASSTSQPPPTPTLPSLLVKKSVIEKEQMAAPLFSFGSKDATRTEFSSTTTMSSFSEASGLGNGISNPTTSAALKSSVADKDDGQMATNLSKSVEGAVDTADKSTSNIPIVFSFGASADKSTSNIPIVFSSGATRNENLPNGSVNSSSAAPVTAGSGSAVSMIFSTTAAVSASSSGISVSSQAPKFSTVPAYQSGSKSSLVSPTSVSQPLDKSFATDMEGKSGKESPVSINSDNLGSSPNFKYGGSSSPVLMASSSFSRVDSGSILAASTVSSIGNSSIASVGLTLFSTAGGSQSALVQASTFSGASTSIFKFGSTQSNSPSSSVMDNSLKASVSGFVGTQSTQAESGNSYFSQSTASQLGPFYSPPTFGMNVPSTSSLGSSQLGVTTGSNPFSSSSTFSFPVGGSSSLSATSSFAPAATSSAFGSTLQPPSSSSAFGSSASSPSTGFIFGVSASGSSPFPFGSSSAPAFSTNPSGASSSPISSAQPVFGSLNSAVGFSSGTPGNDQMNVEDSMAEDTNQSAANLVPQFGQTGTSSSMPVFGSPVTQPAAPVFQFGSQQISAVPQSSLFQATGSLESRQVGSFSLGSGGGDKSGRRIVKVKRDKMRKK